MKQSISSSNVGVEELDQEKLTPLLRLKYKDSIADALADLGASHFAYTKGHHRNMPMKRKDRQTRSGDALIRLVHYRQNASGDLFDRLA